MKWEEWRGSLDGRPTMWIKRLAWIPVWLRAGKWLGCRVDLHKFVRADDPDCFHSHPAWAIRIVLAGGYIEQTPDGARRTWLPGDIGIIRPSFAHRVHQLNELESYSLWLRGPICAEVKLIGEGWAKHG